MPREVRGPRVTFGYAQHSLCGGKARKPTSLGPRKGKFVTQADGRVVWVSESAPPLKPPKPVANEGHYVSREKGYMRWSDFKMLCEFGKQVTAAKPAEPQEESIEEWMKKHNFGPYATA